MDYEIDRRRNLYMSPELTKKLDDFLNHQGMVQKSFQTNTDSVLITVKALEEKLDIQIDNLENKNTLILNNHREDMEKGFKHIQENLASLKATIMEQTGECKQNISEINITLKGQDARITLLENQPDKLKAGAVDKIGSIAFKLIVTAGVGGLIAFLVNFFKSKPVISP